nr:hypothetical protein OHB51_11630 [Micromonospora sp. NBC_00855]
MTTTASITSSHRARSQQVRAGLVTVTPDRSTVSPESISPWWTRMPAVGPTRVVAGTRTSTGSFAIGFAQPYKPAAARPAMAAPAGTSQRPTAAHRMVWVTVTWASA